MSFRKCSYTAEKLIMMTIHQSRLVQNLPPSLLAGLCKRPCRDLFVLGLRKRPHTSHLYLMLCFEAFVKLFHLVVPCILV